MTDYRIRPAREQQIERDAARDAYEGVLLQIRKSVIDGDWTLGDFEAWLELKVSRCGSPRDCCAANCDESATPDSDYCSNHQPDQAAGGFYDFADPPPAQRPLDRRIVDLVGFIPMASILIAQATGRDKIWLVCNLLFLCYHAFFTKLKTQLLCSLILTAICLWRLSSG